MSCCVGAGIVKMPSISDDSILEEDLDSATESLTLNDVTADVTSNARSRVVDSLQNSVTSSPEEEDAFATQQEQQSECDVIDGGKK